MNQQKFTISLSSMERDKLVEILDLYAQKSRKKSYFETLRNMVKQDVNSVYVLSDLVSMRGAVIWYDNKHRTFVTTQLKWYLFYKILEAADI